MVTVGLGLKGASLERTAYPRFKRIISERELAQFFTPDEAEIAWAAKRTHERPESLLTLLVLLKSCARLGYFPGLGDVPALVVDRVRAVVGLPQDVDVGVEERTVKRYRFWIREYLDLVHDPARARKVAAAAMEEAAPVRASVVDLVGPTTTPWPLARVMVITMSIDVARACGCIRCRPSGQRAGLRRGRSLWLGCGTGAVPRSMVCRLQDGGGERRPR